MTYETLGVYKVAMYITADGYLWTNAFNYQYLFDIGEDSAGKIIKYAKENSEEAAYEPYQNAVTGEITQITDEYILIDDSLLCNDPSDRLVYKIMLDDIRVLRYVENNIIKVGDTVQITYEGVIDEHNSNTVTLVKTISKVRILFEENEKNNNSYEGDKKATLTTSKRYDIQNPE